MKNILKLFKRLIYIIIGRDIFVHVQKQIHKEKHGDKNASWVIHPDKISRDSIIYSFGIGYDISFDLSLIDKFDVTIHAFDPTPRSIQWLKEQRLPDSFHYHEYGLADFDGMVEFYPPDNPEFISHTVIHNEYSIQSAIKVQMYRLNTIMRQLKHSKIDLLKMDIEGAEYAVLEDILNSHLDIEQILIEFHHRFKNIDVIKTKNAVNLLNSNGYQIFSVSLSGEEFGFIRT